MQKSVLTLFSLLLTSGLYAASADLNLYGTTALPANQNGVQTDPVLTPDEFANRVKTLEKQTQANIKEQIREEAAETKAAKKGGALAQPRTDAQSTTSPSPTNGTTTTATPTPQATPPQPLPAPKQLAPVAPVQPAAPAPQPYTGFGAPQPAPQQNNGNTGGGGGWNIKY